MDSTSIRLSSPGAHGLHLASFTQETWLAPGVRSLKPSALNLSQWPLSTANTLPSGLVLNETVTVHNKGLCKPDDYNTLFLITVPHPEPLFLGNGGGERVGSAGHFPTNLSTWFSEWNCGIPKVFVCD